MGRAVSPDAQTTEPRLYNLDTEIGEQTNLAKEHPEIVAKLKALAEKINTEIGGPSPTSRRPAGKVEKPTFLYQSEARNKAKK